MPISIDDIFEDAHKKNSWGFAFATTDLDAPKKLGSESQYENLKYKYEALKPYADGTNELVENVYSLLTNIIEEYENKHRLRSV